MKLTAALALLVVLLSSLLIFSLKGWGDANGRARHWAERMTVMRGVARADSIMHEARTRQLRAAVERLRTDSAHRYRELAAARAAKVASDSSLQAILALLPAATREAVLRHIRVLAEEGESCAITLDNCEERAANAEARASEHVLMLATERALRQTADSAYQDAERRAKPNLVRDLWRTRTVWGAAAGVVAVLKVVELLRQ